jgi:hypothetical protein
VSLGADVASYLLLVPLILYLDTGPLAKAGGLTYSIAGACGAAALAGAWPVLLHMSARTEPAFAAITAAVEYGLWNIVAVLGLGVWMAITGRRIGGMSGVLGVTGAIAACADALCVIVGRQSLSAAALGVFAVVSVWFISSVAITLLRDPTLVTLSGRPSVTFPP